MRSLSVVGSENGFLIVVSDDGERFQIAVNSQLTDAVRRSRQSDAPSRHQVSPRDIQAHIRRGLSAQQVADLTGESLEYVERFEGPVIAEREFVTEQARLVELAPVPADKDHPATFGELVDQRLAELDAGEIRWSSWKEEGGWMVEVSFTEGSVEHSAKWAFDQRKQVLNPANPDAVSLSQESPLHGPLIPRLRAIHGDEKPAPERFESEVLERMSLEETGPLLEPVPYGKTTQDPASDAVSNTADLLEALRRRRGEREPAPDGESDLSRNAHPSTGSIRLVPDEDEQSPGESTYQAPVYSFPQRITPDYQDESIVEDIDNEPGLEPPVEPKPSSRKGRPQMPSWDDIVFGTKPDED